MTDILFLGTGASIPSKTRALPCVAVRHGSEMILFDCGEGAQRQFMLSPFSFMKVSAIFVTHLHGDHILGLPGLLQTMGMSGRKNELMICGPPGTENAVRCLLKACDRSYTDHDPDAIRDLEFPLKVVEMEDSDFIELRSCKVHAFTTDHGVKSIGFKFIENDLPGKFDRDKAIKSGLRPGKDFSDIQNGISVNGVNPIEIVGPPRPGCSIIYTGDTVPCDRLNDMAMHADMIIHESTYSAKDSKLAADNKHSTAENAAELALRSNTRMLVLTHVSNRYDDLNEISDEAKAIFKNTLLAQDMMMLTMSKKDIRSV